MAAAQMALPGLEPPDPVAEARAEADRIGAEWKAVCHILDSPERSRLQPLYCAALKRWHLLAYGWD